MGKRADWPTDPRRKLELIGGAVAVTNGERHYQLFRLISELDYLKRLTSQIDGNARKHDRVMSDQLKKLGKRIRDAGRRTGPDVEFVVKSKSALDWVGSFSSVEGVEVTEPETEEEGYVAEVRGAGITARGSKCNTKALAICSAWCAWAGDVSHKRLAEVEN